MIGAKSRRAGERRIWRDDTDQVLLNLGAGSRVDIPTLEAKTFTVRPGFEVVVRFRMPWNTHGAIGGVIRAYIADGTGADAAAVVKAAGQSAQARAANAEVGCIDAEEVIDVPGTYTRKPQVGASTASGAGAGMLANATTRPAFSILERPLR